MARCGRCASLAGRPPGEVHGLLGANGAGKSTLVEDPDGALSPDWGASSSAASRARCIRRAEARKAGMVSVYQEPALIPDLDVESNLRLTLAPVEPFMGWVSELGVPALDRHAMVRDLPLAVLRILDLARALAIDPDVLLLDEMTAALPADLAERVLDVVGRRRDRPVGHLHLPPPPGDRGPLRSGHRVA